MLIVPLYIFLFIYLIFLAIFAAFSLVNIYHIIMSASFTLSSFVISFFISILTILTLYFTWYLLIDVNWKETIIFFDSTWIN